MGRFLQDLLNLPGDSMAGVVVSNGALEWASIRRSKDGWKKTGSGKVSLPPAPVEGQEEQRAAQVLEARKEVEKAGLAGRVAVGLSSGDLLLRILDLPDVPEDEIRGMVTLQVDKLSPFPVENMVVSHEVVDRREGKSRVLVAAVKTEIVQALGTELAGLGMDIGHVDAAILGWWHALKEAGHVRPEGRQAFIFTTGAVPELVVSQGMVPIAFRVLGESEGLEGHEFDLETARAVSYTLMSLEMEHGSDAYTISLWHGGASPAGLAEALRAECSCEINLNSVDGLTTVAESMARRAMAEVPGLNLFPSEWKAEGASLLFRRRMTTAALAVAALWLVLVLGLGGSYFYQQGRLAGLKTDYARWHREAREVSDTRGKVTTLRQYMDSSRSALECLRELSERMPPGVSMTSFSYKKGEEAKVSGEAASVNDVYNFKNQLDAGGFFENVALNGPTFDGRRNKQTFDLDLKLGGGKP